MIGSKVTPLSRGLGARLEAGGAASRCCRQPRTVMRVVGTRGALSCMDRFAPFFTASAGLASHMDKVEMLDTAKGASD